MGNVDVFVAAVLHCSPWPATPKNLFSEFLVLCLSREFRNEWTADGRPDGKAAGYLRLAGVHAVALPS